MASLTDGNAADGKIGGAESLISGWTESGNTQPGQSRMAGGPGCFCGKNQCKKPLVK